MTTESTLRAALTFGDAEYLRLMADQLEASRHSRLFAIAAAIDAVLSAHPALASQEQGELSDALKRLQVWRDGAGLKELDTIGGEGYRPGNERFALDVAALLTAYKAADRAARPESVEDVGLPPKYMLAKLQMVMPLFQEARDALPAISVTAAKLHGVDLSLGDRMDRAGTFSLDDWNAAIAKGAES